ncbi:hypothetical protein GCM10009712_14070 [Pseudarthrobacter sulfonivorans]
MRGVQVHEPAPAAVDEHRSGGHHGEPFGVDEVVVFRRQRHVQRDEVAAAQQFLDSFAADAGRDVRKRIKGQDLEVEGLRDPGHAAPDAPVTDDAQGEALQVTDGHPGPLVPAAVPDQRRQRRELLDQCQQVGEHAFGDGRRIAAGCDDHGDAAAVRLRDVHEVGADAGPGDDLQGGHPVQEFTVHAVGGADNGGIGPGEVRVGGIVDDLLVRSQFRFHQAGLDAAKSYDYLGCA